MRIHPLASQVLTVINNFKKVLPMAKREDHLNMGCTSVNRSHECGTVHCHGGWYAISVLDVENKLLSYTDGADRLAKDLGFGFDEDIQEWAEQNQTLWGNEIGYGMFCDRRAFKSPDRPDGANNLQDIISHWTEVYERLLVFEGSERPVYENISKDLAVLPISETADQPIKQLS